MEGGSIMIILTPLLLPVLASYEVDPVHFGVVFQLAIMIGLLTPPVGILLFVMAGVSQVSVKDILANLLAVLPGSCRRGADRGVRARPFPVPGQHLGRPD